MNKRLVAIASIGLTVSVFVIGAAACSSDSTPNTFPEGEQDATFDQGGGFNTDGTTTGKDVVGPVTCTPQLPAAFSPVFKAPTKKAVCSDGDIAGYYDTCIAPLATDPDAGPGCKAWIADHAACGGCLENPEGDNNGPLQFYSNRLYYTLNVAGCISILRSETAPGTCAAAYDDSFQCQRASCNECLKQEGATFTNFQECQKAAKTSACATYETKRTTACGAITSPDAGAFDCFNHGGGETTKVHFTRVEKIFCGQ